MFGRIYIILLLCLAAFPGTQLWGQEHFLVYGRVKTETGRLENARIIVEKDGVKDRALLVEGSGKFEFKLDFNSHYIISFSQDGYVTKKVSFETTAPPERIQFGFDPFEFQVTIFKQFDDISTVIFNQPVGQIMFSREYDDFDFDKDYSKTILRQMEEVEEESKKKAEEEEKNEKEREKKKEKEKKEEPLAEKPTPEPEKEVAKVEKKEDPPPPPRSTPPPVEKKDPQPKTYAAASYSRGGNMVILHAYTVGEYNYPNLPAYGYINFGNGGGNQEISREQFLQYAQQYR